MENQDESTHAHHHCTIDGVYSHADAEARQKSPRVTEMMVLYVSVLDVVVRVARRLQTRDPVQRVEISVKYTLIRWKERNPRRIHTKYVQASGEL